MMGFRCLGRCRSDWRQDWDGRCALDRRVKDLVVGKSRTSIDCRQSGFGPTGLSMNEMRAEGQSRTVLTGSFWPENRLGFQPSSAEISHVARFAWAALYMERSVVLWVLCKSDRFSAGCGIGGPSAMATCVGASANGKPSSSSRTE